jgi:hypothetical protein
MAGVVGVEAVESVKIEITSPDQGSADDEEKLKL